jgi:hypothetical protein
VRVSTLEDRFVVAGLALAFSCQTCGAHAARPMPCRPTVRPASRSGFRPD